MDERLFATGIIRPDEGTTASELLDQLAAGPPAWMRDALCREPHPGANWFPERGEDASRAKAVCRRCLVLEECRAYAGTDREIRGIWGGLSERQRHRQPPAGERHDVAEEPAPAPAKPPRPRRPPAEHGTMSRYNAGCSCEACRAENNAVKAHYRRRRRAS